MKGKANTAHCLRFPGDWYDDCVSLLFGLDYIFLGRLINLIVTLRKFLCDILIGCFTCISSLTAVYIKTYL